MSQTAGLGGAGEAGEAGEGAPKARDVADRDGDDDDDADLRTGIGVAVGLFHCGAVDHLTWVRRGSGPVDLGLAGQ